MTMPTPGEARSRQTDYLATEHWWRSRVEAQIAEWRALAAAFAVDDGIVSDTAAGWLQSCAHDLEALIAERNPR